MRLSSRHTHRRFRGRAPSQHDARRRLEHCAIGRGLEQPSKTRRLATMRLARLSTRPSPSSSPPRSRSTLPRPPATPCSSSELPPISPWPCPTPPATGRPRCERSRFPRSHSVPADLASCSALTSRAMPNPSPPVCAATFLSTSTFPISRRFTAEISVYDSPHVDVFRFFLRSNSDALTNPMRTFHPQTEGEGPIEVPWERTITYPEQGFCMQDLLALVVLLRPRFPYHAGRKASQVPNLCHGHGHRSFAGLFLLRADGNRRAQAQVVRRSRSRHRALDCRHVR